ncbi:MAG: sporulation protein YunB [Clostridiales bacterium]|nr:MAG: sporulation protein YunB [Clostridiales bacterium]
MGNGSEKYRLKIMPNPAVDVNFRDDFTSAGVNQTIHKNLSRR